MSKNMCPPEGETDQRLSSEVILVFKENKRSTD